MLKEGTGSWVGPQRGGVACPPPPGAAWDVGHKHPWQGISTEGLGHPSTPVMTRVLCPWGAAQCQTPSFVPPSPAALGASGDPPLPVGVGTRDLCEQGGLGASF